MTTLADLELRDLDGLELSALETKALECFRKLRLKKLKKKKHQESLFHQSYEMFRRLSNTLDYNDFLADNCKNLSI